MPFFPYDSWGMPPSATPWFDAQQAGTGTSVLPPSNATFTTRYPAFAAVDAAVITAVLAEAAHEVDSTWATADQAPAIMAFAAHLLATEGIGADSVSVAGSSLVVAGPVSELDAGDTKVKFSTAGQVRRTQAADPNDLASTSYGLRFLALQSRNVGAGVLVV